MTSRRCNISVVICSLNRMADLRECLRALNGDEMVDADGELVLVDNGSADETFAEMCRYRDAAAFPVTVLREERKGKSVGLNKGLACARGGIVVFTDDDCRLEPGYLRTARKMLEDGVVDYGGGRIWLPDERCARMTCNYDSEPRTFAPYSFIPAGAFQGANMLFRREVIEAVGPFDEKMGPGTALVGEDLDYAVRASWKGFRGAHVPELIVVHHHNRDNEDARSVMALYDRGRGACYIKFVCAGRFVYLKAWWRSYLDNRRRMGAYKARKKLARELAGAAQYVRMRVVGR